MNIGNLAPISEVNESQQQRKYSHISKNLPIVNTAMPKANTFQINNINNLNKIGLVNQGYNNYNYNYNNQFNNFRGPILPLPIQGIPGNQINIMPQMQLQQGGQTLSSVQTIGSYYIYNGGIYKQNNFQ